MRIRSTQETHARFWDRTRLWLRSADGVRQFLLAAAVGFGLTLALALGYKVGGWRVIDPLTKAVAESLAAETQSTTEQALKSNDLPTLYLDIGFEEYQALAAQREEALQRGILLVDDDDWVRAQIRYRDDTLPVRIRLKGDWLDHLGENKWSFRVKTRRGTALFGMRSFSLQSPATRLYLNEWLFLEDLRRAGILAPRYSFVNLTVNGEDWGIYALEESFSKELLESQGRREGVIVRFDEDLFWRRRALFGGEDESWKYSVDPIAATFELPAFAEVDAFGTNKIAADPVLSAQGEAALGLLRGWQAGKLSTGQVFDAELTGRYLAHINLWGARHGIAWHNARYYYNPLTTRLEPIGYDNLPLEPVYSHFVDLSQYDDLGIMRAYVQEVARIARPDYLAELRDAYESQFEHYRAVLSQEFDLEHLQPPWDTLATRQEMLLDALHPPQTVYAYQVARDADEVELQVGNILQYPVVLRSLRVAGRDIPISPSWITDTEHLLHTGALPEIVLRREMEQRMRYLTLRVPSSILPSRPLTAAASLSPTLQLVTSLYGVTDTVVVDVRNDYPAALSHPLLPPRPTVAEALARYPFLKPAEQDHFLELRSGDWQVTGDLILPDGYGLWGTEPVTLTFAPGAILFSNGPLLLRGPEVGSITFAPALDTWGGIVVLQAGDDVPSALHNVEIRATSGISRDGWMTTGGVTFYESPVIMTSSRLLDSVAEDTINVVRSRFEFADSEFGNAASDAFDGDFVQGRVQDCSFHDVRGDGIDVSGSQITVEGVNLLRVYDKGISAGEGSIVTVNDLHAADIGIAVAAKDLSSVTVEKAAIARAWVAGLAAYLKKMEYGPASLTASYVTFEDHSPQTLVQTGSSVQVNGRPAPAADLDVSDLYRRMEALARMHPLNYRLGDAIRLVGYDLTQDDGAARLTLYWQSDAPLEHDYTVFVHILDDDGNLAAQRDNMPQDGDRPTTGWEVGELIEDLHTVPLPPDLPPGRYQVVIGLYLWQTGERLPVHRLDGVMLPNGAIPLGAMVIGQ